MAALVLVAAAQPLFAEDTWWHLTMGRAYAAHGPWLAEDPALFTAAGPPHPAAWLTDLALHAVERATLFRGLRVAHALAVAAILLLAWSALRRASRSAAFASLSVTVFAALAAYRLFQLRAHLATLLATLLVIRLLLCDGGAPSRRRVAVVAVVFAVWANAHAGFVLGLALLGAAVAGCAVALRLPGDAFARSPLRAKRLAAALALGAVATLANPAGPGAHLPVFRAGRDTPDLAVVADEWTPFHPFELPVPWVPPSALSWTAVWVLMVGSAGAAVWHLRARRRGGAPPLDPALLALAAASFLAMFRTARLVWLGVGPLLLVGHCARALGAFAPPRRAVAWATGALAALLVPAFVWAGAWPMISQGVRPASYALPYPPGKFDADAVWFLRDAGLEGNLWSDYQSANFLGYWLAPRMRVFVNGSLNVPPRVMRDLVLLRQRRGRGGESFPALLDRYGVDVFFGTGAPVFAAGGRPRANSTPHLERTLGWTPVFRSARNAVYLRADASNRENLERVAAYYEGQGVPFDPVRGFDPGAVMETAPRWAFDHGIVPGDFLRLAKAAGSLDADAREPARERLASIYALLGLYDAAAELDRPRTNSIPATRRLLWSLLRAGGDEEEIRAVADRLEALAPDDALSRQIVAAARERPDLSEEEAAARVSALPVFTEPQLAWVLSGFRPPEARERRP